MRRPSAILVLAVVLVSGCRNGKEEERRRAEQATAEAEEKAREATLTSARLEAKDDASAKEEAAQRANGETLGAFRLEQADFRKRLQRSLGSIEGEMLEVHRAGGEAAAAKLGELRARRDLLKSDLEAVDRSVEPDWATLRTKVERDLRQRAPSRP